MLGVCFALPLLAFVGAVPIARETTFIGEGTNYLASALLQGHINENSNMVFSPLGLNAILAIFAEGSRGPSRDEIATALRFPADIQAVRQGYQAVLRRLSDKHKANAPEMKNWFYIYKNYTVDEGLKDILREYYLTEVKSVDRPEDYLGSSDEEQKTKVKVPSGLQGKPTDHLIDVDKEVGSIIDSASSPHKSDGEEAATNQQPSLLDSVEPQVMKTEEKKPEVMAEEKKPEMMAEEKKPEMMAEEKKPEMMAEEKKPETMAEEKKPVMPTEEMKLENLKEDEKKTLQQEQTLTESKVPEMVKHELLNEEKKPEDVVKAEETVSQVVPEKETLPGSANSHEKTQLSGKDELKKEEESLGSEAASLPSGEKMGEKEEMIPLKVEKEKEEEKLPVMVEEKMPLKEENEIKVDEEKKEKEKDEMMVAMQKRSIQSIDDMSGMTDSAVKIKGNGSVSQMIVFNGLYFKGDWNTQFVKMRADDSKPFYKATGEKVFVQTLHAEGLFETADLPDLKSRAVELKYEGGRYSLLLLLPRKQDGLDQLVSDLADYPISRIYDKLDEKLLDLCLPTFDITTISKPISSTKKAGYLKVKNIFDPEAADLSGISTEPGLFVEELVQLVVFTVDSNYTEANFLTASVASSRSDLEKFEVNHPFLFYLRDNVDGIIIVNGKVSDPTPTEDDFTVKSLRNAVRNAVE